MLLYFCGASLLLTRLYNASGGSLLLVALAHLAAHLNNSHRALPADLLPLVAHSVILAALGLLLMQRTLPGGGSTRRQQPKAERPASTGDLMLESAAR
ncbi:MAG TPA: hypothetical protein VIW29_00735, partial [Polyangiaceae bacterium]